MEKQEYEELVVDVIAFDTDDVIVTSGELPVD